MCGCSPTLYFVWGKNLFKLSTRKSDEGAAVDA